MSVNDKGRNIMTNQMYSWVDQTVNPITGWCKHNCDYCYMKSPPLSYNTKYQKKEYEIDKKHLDRIDNDGKIYFIGSATDIFGEWVDRRLIKRVLEKCKEAEDNLYLFQSKNPRRFGKFSFPENIILATTLETNRDYHITNAPKPRRRARHFRKVIRAIGDDVTTLVSVEPIMDFDRKIFKKILKDIDPDLVSFGADSKSNDLLEPTFEKTISLMRDVSKFSNVIAKDNLNSISDNGEGYYEEFRKNRATKVTK